MKITAIAWLVSKMMKNREEKLISDEIKKLVPVLGKPTAERLEKAYLLGDERIRERVIEMVDITKAAVYSDSELRDTVLLEPPECMDGDIELGKILYGRKAICRFAMATDQLLTHVGVFGSSGYGKTNISYNMIEELSENNIPVIVFDFSKRNYKDLLSTKLKDRIDIYTVGRDAAMFSFNPLKPPQGIDLTQWIKEFASIFDHAYWLLGGGTHVITKALSGVYKEKRNPRLNDLKEWLDTYFSSIATSRERNWLATAQRPLESLCMPGVCEIFNCNEGIKPSEFFKPGKITILELDALSTNDKTFFIEIMLQWIRDWLLVNNSREELKGVVILEEAHHILNREKAKKLGTETVIDLVFREVRELGLGIVYLDQHPSLVSYPALGNTSTHIYLNLGLDTHYASDIKDASRMLGLDEDDEKYIRQLPVGQGFMLMRRSEHPRPFIVGFNKFDMIKGSVTDEHIRQHMSSRIQYDEKEGTAEKIDMPIEKIDDNCWRIIKAIGEGKGLSTSQIYKSLKMSGTTFNDAVQKLKASGIIDCKEVKRKNSKAYYYFLTDMGEQVFDSKFKNEAKEIQIDKSGILNIFLMNKWTCNKLGENEFELTGNGSKINLIFAANPDRKAIFKVLRNGYYYIAATEEIGNIITQQAARHAKNKRIAISLAIADEFRNNYGFQRLEL